jgi:hypothetical protein
MPLREANDSPLASPIQTDLAPGNPVINALSTDPFSREFLLDPYPHHEQMRQHGPVIWLERYGIWGMARHEHVFKALNDWPSFCSSAGVGLSNFRTEKPWRPPSLLLEADPPLHTRTRGVITNVLSRRTINTFRARFALEAEQLVDRLLEQRQFDAIQDLATAFPLKVFPDVLGIEAHSREYLLHYGNMAFNAFGPRNQLFEDAMTGMEPVSAWVLSQCQRDALAPGGLGAQIFAAADAGTVTAEEAQLLVRSLLSAGVDTTVTALGNALVCLTRHASAWRALRKDPSLVRSAFEEVMRYESPVQTFFRTTTRAIEVGGTVIPEGAKVLLFLGAANRDSRRWVSPDTFDIERNASGHVGFGAGIHACVGQMIARLEAETLLRELLRRVEAIEPTGDPVPRLNNTLRGWQSLPVAVKSA